MKKSIITILFMSIFLFSINSIVSAASLIVTKDDVKKTGTITNGVMYESFTGTLTNDAGTPSNQLFSYVKANANTVKVVSHSYISKDGIIGKNVRDLALDFENKNPGYKVIAGINADYFSASNGLMYPINALVSNGDVIKYNNHTKYQSIAISDSGSNFVFSKINSVSSNFYLTIYDEFNAPVFTTVLVGQNILPSTNQTTFFYKDNTLKQVDTNTTAYEISAPNAYFNLASIFIKGKVSKIIDKTSTNPCILTTNEEVKKLLDTYPQIRIQKNMTDSNDSFNTVIGVGSQPLKNNEIQSNAAIGDQSLSFTTARHPRSSIGFTKNGDIIIGTIDGRQTNMEGASLREEAAFMKYLGCTDCFNFDGGGSTELIIRNENDFIYLNSPSEKYRNVVDAILFVVPDISINATVVKENDTYNINYSLTENNANLTNIDIYLNGQKQDIITTSFSINKESLRSNMDNYLTFVANYEKDGLNYNRAFKTLLIKEENNDPVPPIQKQKPSAFLVSFEEIDEGFKGIITYKDPSNVLTKMYLVDGTNKIPAIKETRLDNNGNEYSAYVATIKDNQTKAYDFKIEFYYRMDTLNPVSEIYETSYSYNYPGMGPTNFNIDFKSSANSIKLEVSYDSNNTNIKEIEIIYGTKTLVCVDNSTIINNPISGKYEVKIRYTYISNNLEFTKECPKLFTYEYIKPTSSGCNSKTVIFGLLNIVSVLSLIIIKKKK